MSGNSLVATIFTKYRPSLLRYIARKFGSTDEAEDIVQDVIHNMIRADQDKKLESIDNMEAYLYRSAFNLAVDRVRKQTRHNDYINSAKHDEESGATIERSFNAQRNLDSVEIKLGELPEKCRQAFLLNRIHGKKHKEISQELGVSVSSVEKYIMTTMKFLNKHLDIEEK